MLTSPKAGLGFRVELGGVGGGATMFGQLLNDDHLLERPLANSHLVTHVNGLGPLHSFPLQVNLAALDGGSREGPGLEKAGGPEPAIQSDVFGLAGRFRRHGGAPDSTSGRRGRGCRDGSR